MQFGLPEHIQKLLDSARQQQQKVVLVTGVFDLLHQEHRIFLEKAQQAGDVLIVGIEADSRVKKIKGENRPMWSQTKRLDEINRLSVADGVFVLPEQFDTPEDREQLIALIRPSILAVSSHSPHRDKKEAIVSKYGGKVVVVHQFNPALSTTQLIQQHINNE